MQGKSDQGVCVYLRLTWLNQYPSFPVIGEQKDEKHEKSYSKKNEEEKKKESQKNETRGGKMLSLYEYPGLALLG